MLRPDGRSMKSLRRWCLLRDWISWTRLLRCSWLRPIWRLSFCLTACCTIFTVWTWAMRPARCATAWGLRGEQRWTAWVWGGRSWLAAVSVSLEDSDKSLSTPVLEFLPLGPYTDMLGCSISRFSIGLASTLSSDWPPAVKQGGGVTNQLSPEHAISGKVLMSLLESLESWWLGGLDGTMKLVPSGLIGLNLPGLPSLLSANKSDRIVYH